MRSSEFWSLVDHEFGAVGRTLVGDQVLFELGNRTAEQALADGVEERTVWFALCDAMQVPEERRWGQEEDGPRRRRRRV